MTFKRYLKKAFYNTISFLLFFLGILIVIGGLGFASLAFYLATYEATLMYIGLGLGFIISSWIVGQYFIYKSPDYYGHRKIDN